MTLTRMLASGGALEGYTARFGRNAVTAWGSVCAPRGVAPVGTEWYASDVQVRNAETIRIELGPRIIEHRERVS